MGQIEVLEGHFQSGESVASLAPLEEIAAAERKAFRLRPDGRWEPLQVFADRYYHLVPTGGAPTVEIDGIQMHRTSGTEPFTAAREAAASVVRPGGRGRDPCGGLGYTAIQAARLGASEVVSTEVSEGVLCLRRLNPWSRLEAGLPIGLIEEDAFLHLARAPAGSFDSVIHDPPRFTLASDLYSDAFYLRLHDVLRPGGRLFHYTGSPYSRGRGRDFLGGVVERLRRAGFKVLPRGDLQGFVCTRRGSGP